MARLVGYVTADIPNARNRIGRGPATGRSVFAARWGQPCRRRAPTGLALARVEAQHA